MSCESVSKALSPGEWAARTRSAVRATTPGRAEAATSAGEAVRHSCVSPYASQALRNAASVAAERSRHSASCASITSTTAIVSGAP